MDYRILTSLHHIRTHRARSEFYLFTMVFAATASRVALGSTRTAALRRSTQLAPVVAGSRIASRANSTSSSHHGEHKKTSDLPWAISSALFFGSAFIYLTSPASKTHNEHGHVTGAKEPKNHGTGTARTDDRTGDDAVWKQAEGEEHKAAVPTDTRYEDSAQDGDMVRRLLVSKTIVRPW